MLKRFSFGITIALAFCVCAFAQSQKPSPTGGVVKSSQQQSDAQGSKGQASNDQRGTTQTPFIIQQLSAPKTPEETNKDAADREAKAAQEREALILNVLTIIVLALQLAAFIYQGIKLRQTVDAMTGQSADTKKSIAEAARAANAMEAVATTIKNNAAIQVRAYVSVIPGAIVEQNELPMECQPIVVNGGFTPASNVIVYSKTDVLPFPLPAEFDFSIPEGPNPSVAVLGFQQRNIAVSALDRMLTADEILEIKASKTRKFYNYGSVTYTDVFGKPWHTNFCFYVVWGSKGIPVAFTTTRHNDAS